LPERRGLRPNRLPDIALTGIKGGPSGVGHFDRV
jgi:hypothetical protein